ncbi:MAG: MotA/TolQ/ExbB proton channel family protein [Opitutales bacterium]|nr:MotA/TolQ/ExbB proton channel family protein [Opitutales bacterium]
MGDFLNEVNRLWSGNAWLVMLPLAALGIFLYHYAFSLWIEVRRHPLARIRKEPEASSAPDSSNLYPVRCRDRVKWVREDFKLRHQKIFQPIDRRLQYVVVLTSAAPLLGLLGTILGMSDTFSVMATGGSGLLDRMAEGIGTALLSTQLGLLLAIPGTFAAVAIRRQRNRMEANLSLQEVGEIKKAFGGYEEEGVAG